MSDVDVQDAALSANSERERIALTAGRALARELCRLQDQVDLLRSALMWITSKSEDHEIRFVVKEALRISAAGADQQRTAAGSGDVKGVSGIRTPYVAAQPAALSPQEICL